MGLCGARGCAVSTPWGDCRGGRDSGGEPSQPFWSPPQTSVPRQLWGSAAVPHTSGPGERQLWLQRVRVAEGLKSVWFKVARLPRGKHVRVYPGPPAGGSDSTARAPDVSLCPLSGSASTGPRRIPRELVMAVCCCCVTSWTKPNQSSPGSRGSFCPWTHPGPGPFRSARPVSPCPVPGVSLPLATGAAMFL